MGGPKINAWAKDDFKFIVMEFITTPNLFSLDSKLEQICEILGKIRKYSRLICVIENVK